MEHMGKPPVGSVQQHAPVGSPVAVDVVLDSICTSLVEVVLEAT
jgi:hypothetical protein